jgi:hypothetical protein
MKQQRGGGKTTTRFGASFVFFAHGSFLVTLERGLWGSCSSITAGGRRDEFVRARHGTLILERAAFDVDCEVFMEIFGSQITLGPIATQPL